MSGGGAYFEQFIEEYYAECEEHLATARRVLLGLESAAGARPAAAALHDLHRSLHTLKGLSGMVGDQSAERVAHALEDAMRGVERGESAPDARLVDALFAGIETLERCVAAHRAGEAAPDVTALVETLGQVSGEDRRAGLPAVGVAPVDSLADAADDATLYRFEFVPSAALAARGIGVDVIRARLRALGTMLDARPRVTDGGVAFDFTVAVPADARPDDAWSADGLRWTRSEPSRATDGASAAAKSGAAAATSGASSPAPGATSTGVVRVELTRLDDVMRLVGDLVVGRSRLDGALRNAAHVDRATLLDELDETNAAMERQLRQLREAVMRIRLVPVGEVFERLRFAARDAIRESGKQVRLAFHGQATEIDKVVVDRMLEPLLHLVRNAVSHGIEAPAERERLGKPAEGLLTLRAATSGDRILIAVEDDGAGIDVGSVARRARLRGLLGPDESLDGQRLLDVLCAPGFSTRDEADRTSGRGVGMDVVRAAVHALSGELAMESEPGRGTRFTIELPLTLMILDALLVDVGGQQMAVPQPALREVLRVEQTDIVTFENNDVVRYRDGVLPVVSLARLFAFPDVPSTASYLLVVGSETAPIGLRVDRLIGLREIVVHPVPDPLVAMPGVGGATDLGNGRVSLILDAAAVLRLAEESRAARALPRPVLAGTPTSRRDHR